MAASIESSRIKDPVNKPDGGAVEVVIRLKDGSERWCFFFDPARLTRVGDWVEGTAVRVHLGVEHMIVVSELSEDIIARVLHQLEAEGELLNHTRPCGGRVA